MNKDKNNGEYRSTSASSYSNSDQTSNTAHKGTSTQTPSNSSTSERNAGIRAGEIVGYRAWALNLRTMELHSTWVVHTWHPSIYYTAVDLKDDYGFTQMKDFSLCMNAGFYAFKSKLRCSLTKFHPFPNFPIVRGSIYMWGTVFEHQRGYRSEYAAIRSLDSISFGTPIAFFNFNRKKEILNILREKYNVKSDSELISLKISN